MTKETTPLYNFLNDFIKSDKSRFFMPGHKGNHPNEILNKISQFDITEITGADSLYEAEGILLQSEKIASDVYESGVTVFSAGGSTLCIQTMLSLVLKSGDTVIAARNSHIAFFNSCVLLNINPTWVLPKYNDELGVSGTITKEQVLQAIKDNKNAKAVYITSPDYMGVMSDVKGIAEVCESKGIPLLVDNAHGAHLKLLNEDIHPIKLGATLCCDSAHKTLPVLTGGAYIHTSRSSGFTRDEIKRSMALFGSTSPSYLIMLSLDLCNEYLLNSAKSDFLKLCEQEQHTWEALLQKGFTKLSNNIDPTKITLDGARVGKSGKELYEHFIKYDIEPEYVGERHIVFMISPQNKKRDYDRLYKAISDFIPGKRFEEGKITLTLPKQAMLPREAFFADKERVSVDDALSRISAETKIKCPPGVPVVAVGEIIDEDTQKLLKRSSIFTLNVVQ